MSRIWLSIALVLIALVSVIVSPVPAPAQAQTVMPDGISFVDSATVLEAGGASHTIRLQLTYRGANYSGNQFGIFLQSSDRAILDIPPGTSVVSDSQGQASLNVTTGASYGNVTVTAALLSPDGRVRASKTYAVIGIGTINGLVIDAVGKSIPGATVTLYTLNNSTKGERVQMPGNPTTSAGLDMAVSGVYSFDDVPFGSYWLEASVDDVVDNATINVSHPAEDVDIVIGGYVVPTPTPAPTPTPEPSPTITPIPASPTPAPKQSTGDETRQLIWIGAVALVLAIIIVGVQMLRPKRRKK